ncbi:MAG: hypothetical protein ABSB59_14880 [Streptosporangiaceae bacterium]
MRRTAVAVMIRLNAGLRVSWPGFVAPWTRTSIESSRTISANIATSLMLAIW